jgi:hypothetical protein
MDGAPAVATEIGKRLAQFSRDVDGLIDKITSEWIQISTASGDKGLFDFALDNSDYSLISSSLSLDLSFENFVDVSLSFLWGRLDRCLKVVRSKITTEARATFDRFLTALEVDVRRAAKGVDITELENGIRRARTDLPHVLERLAEWFQLPKQTATAPFPIDDAVTIAVESIRRFYRSGSFHPTVEVECDVMFRGVMLPGLVDALVILFDNVMKHADTASPDVKIRIGCDLEWVTVDVLNNIGAHVASNEARNRVQRIREELRAGGYRRSISKEGGTGFHKIWKIIGHDVGTRSRLEFGFQNDDEFRVELWIDKRLVDASVDG